MCPMHILLVDDEPDFAAAAVEMLRHHSHEITLANTLAQAREEIDQWQPDVLLLDLMLPDGNGLELVPELADSGLLRIILMTGHPGIKSQIRDLSGPAISYLTKPFGGTDLARALSESGNEVRSQRGLHFGCMLGEHELMQAMYKQIDRVARTDTPVLVVGETGTGKELVAQSIHVASQREGQFVAANCGSLTSELAGSELFGHEKGSFTGALRGRAGYFRRADRGTLFLDELTEMPIDLQPYFLRVLETKRALPVGGDKEWAVDVRVVAATNRSPQAAIADKALRADLYFRLSPFPIRVPPLRERVSDIPALAEYFLDEFLDERDGRRFSEHSLNRLKAYRWPGNVRELRHVVQRACIMTDSYAGEIALPERFDSPFCVPASSANGVGDSGSASVGRLEPGRSIREVERELIEQTLAHCDGDKKKAAAVLGISLNTLYNRLNAYKSGD